MADPSDFDGENDDAALETPWMSWGATWKGRRRQESGLDKIE